ncbi:MAG: response regulator transcription factor [Alphaproteobacteria bacterium]|nr:response regulator transcription factor [Alphaproteobacteria bacterium]
MNTSQRIYVVDDDVAICRVLERYLPQYGFEVQSASDGSDLESVLATCRTDLIILDLGLPGDDGFTLTRDIRATSEVPIIILTGRNEEVDRVLGLELGADDYVTKPFSPRELLARIKAVLRRSRRADRAGHTPADVINAAPVTFADWEFDLVDRRLVSPSGVEVKLSNSEFNLLAAFVAAPNRVLSRGELLSLSRKYGDEVLERSIDIQIFRLRQKIEDSCNGVQLIETQRGAGYFFTPEVNPIRKSELR